MAEELDICLVWRDLANRVTEMLDDVGRGIHIVHLLLG